MTIKNQWITGHSGPDQLVVDTYPTIWRSDILVVNIGAFFQNGHDKEEQFRETIDKFMAAARKRYKGTIIWREYSPTHFDTSQLRWD